MKTMIRRFFKIGIDCLQVLLIIILWVLMFPLPMTVGSAAMGWLCRTIGMMMPQTGRIYDNLKKAMPHLSDCEQRRIARGVWDNLGRTLIEYFYLPRLRGKNLERRVEIVGADILETLKNDGKPALIFLGHLANWEIGTLVALRAGLSIAQVYRPLNYPLTDWIINQIHKTIATDVIPKGAHGARHMLDALKKGTHVSLLMDQKLNEGEWIPFFGMPAKTAPAAARMAVRFDCPLVPVRVERFDKMTFRVTFYPPIQVDNTLSPDDKSRALLVEVNSYLENWIRARPEQWFWLHRRWPKNKK